MERLCIYPADVQAITGKSERYSRGLLKKIKSTFKKENHQFITIAEFCNYTGIPLPEVKKILNP